MKQVVVTLEQETSVLISLDKNSNLVYLCGLFSNSACWAAQGLELRNTWCFIVESPERGNTDPRSHNGLPSLLPTMMWVEPMGRGEYWGFAGWGVIFSQSCRARGPLRAAVGGGGGADRGLELHLVWTEISSPHPPTHWLGGQAAGLSPEGQLAWAWRPAGQAR